MATDDSEIYNNHIEDNDSFGIAIVALYQAFDPEEIGDVSALSENNRIYDNTYINNGSSPDQAVIDAGLPGADLLWDAEGYGNVWDEAGASRFPPLLPSSKTPGFLQRALYQITHFLANML